ncbi:hypothetical protein M1373_00125, partial [Candidatus Marsarchaeota archaeon]|nr:hypothetical protein [Candidatus Marsarchaeota archaeon]
YCIVKYAVVLNDSSGSSISNSIYSGSQYSVLLSNSASNYVGNNLIMSGPGAGIALVNSVNNTLESNNESSNDYGLVLNGSSNNNMVMYNKMLGNKLSDYYCSNGNSGINAENGGVNYGVTTHGCHWLAAIQTNAPPLECNAFFSPTTYSISSDAAYGLGALCYGVYSNATTINCNGHTIIATNGGTFASFKNVKDDVIENCYLKGFTTPISISNSSVQVINDVIGSSYIPPNSSFTGYGIHVSASKNFGIDNVSINGTPIGVAIFSSSDGSVENTSVTSELAYDIQSSTSLNMIHDLSEPGTGIGATISNSTGGLYKDDMFNGIIYGMECLLSSQSSTANSDAGGISYSSADNCNWLK